MERQVRFIAGNKVRTWGGWYRHDKVEVDGAVIEGFIQVSRKNKRTESTTHFRDSAVLGHQVDWLIRQQAS